MEMRGFVKSVLSPVCVLAWFRTMEKMAFSAPCVVETAHPLEVACREPNVSNHLSPALLVLPTLMIMMGVRCFEHVGTIRCLVKLRPAACCVEGWVVFTVLLVEPSHRKAFRITRDVLACVILPPALHTEDRHCKGSVGIV